MARKPDFNFFRSCTKSLDIMRLKSEFKEVHFNNTMTSFPQIPKYCLFISNSIKSTQARVCLRKYLIA